MASARAMRARAAYIYIRGEFIRETEALEAAADRRERAAFDREPLQRIRLDPRPGRAHLAPGQLAVGVAVEIEGDVEVAQGDVPAHVDLSRHGGDLQVRVARLVRAGDAGDE